MMGFLSAPADKKCALLTAQPISPATYREQGARTRAKAPARRRVKRRPQAEPPKRASVPA